MVNDPDVADFFADLAPRIETAGALAEALDRNLARRFNTLDYLRDDEQGLSRIIADLLDPRASHGQGWLFLREFLTVLKESILSDHIPRLDEGDVDARVETERSTANRRRIDVSVEITSGAFGSYCLAIENKPYAEDQEDQVADYLDFLRNRYGDRFSLLYLSPDGAPPSEYSASAQVLAEHWSGHFAIWSYRRPDKEWKDGLPRLPCPFPMWLDRCQQRCQVDRLRWFLRDIELFCERKFGGTNMVAHEELDAVSRFVLSDPRWLRTAAAVHECWPDVRDQICRRFLERVCRRVQKDGRLRQLAPDATIGYVYEGQAQKKNRLWVHRERWQGGDRHNPDSGGRYAVRLESRGPGPKGWYIGVLGPKKGDDLPQEEAVRRSDHFAGLTETFSRRDTSPSGWWPWWENLEAPLDNWNSLLPELQQECDAKDDRQMTKQLADRFLEIALAAIPKIDEIDGRTT